MMKTSTGKGWQGHGVHTQEMVARESGKVGEAILKTLKYFELDCISSRELSLKGGFS